MATITAIKDREIIRVSYRYDPPAGESAVVDVTFVLLHRYKDSNGVLNQVVLDSQIVPAAFFRVDGQPQENQSAAQSCEVSFVNSRYAKDLVVKVEEVRNSVPTFKEVSVLDGYQPNVQDLPNNPIKTPEQQENVPPTPQVKPIDNVVITEPAVMPTVYSLEADGLELVQSGERIVYDVDHGFRRVLGGQTSEQILSENTLKNLMPNPVFAGAGATPLNYTIISPGLILSSRLKAGAITGTNSLEIRCQNPNFFNAFNSLILRTDRVSIPQGIPVLSFSTYYKVTLTGHTNPIADSEVKMEFFDSSDVYLGASTKTLNFDQQSRPTYWGRASVTVDNVPLNAAKMQLSIIGGPIEVSDIFTFEVYLPQLEPYSKASSATVVNRIQDIYISTRAIHLRSPLYAYIDSTHTTHRGVRGLLDSTSNGCNGVQWFISGNAMTFRILDPAGVVLSQAISNNISKLDGEAIRYGIAVQGSNLRFYVDNNVLSTHAITNVNYSAVLKVGALFNSNTALNAEIADFRITTVLP